MIITYTFYSRTCMYMCAKYTDVFLAPRKAISCFLVVVLVIKNTTMYCIYLTPFFSHL